MSYLYRPTPVFNPGPPRGIRLSGAVSGGAMRGYDGSVNWKAFFDSKRAALREIRGSCAAARWDRFLGQDDGSSDFSEELPLTPIDTSNISLSPIDAPLPVDLYPMPAPRAGHRSVHSWTDFRRALDRQLRREHRFSGSIAFRRHAGRDVVGVHCEFARVARHVDHKSRHGPANQSRDSARSADDASSRSSRRRNRCKRRRPRFRRRIPRSPAQYTASASALLAQAGVSGTSWLTQSTILPPVPDVAIYGIGVAALIAVVVGLKGGK